MCIAARTAGTSSSSISISVCQVAEPLLPSDTRQRQRAGADAEFAEEALLAVRPLHGDSEHARAARRLFRDLPAEFGQERGKAADVVDEFVTSAGHLRDRL